jgi:RNA polymerase sigma-70 factor (ECF subfamily)
VSTKNRAEDRELASRAARGDLEAFTKLVRTHSSLVYRVALRMMGEQHRAQDATQEVWIRVWKNIQGFRAESAFSTWLYTITINTCLSARQKEARRSEREYSREEMPYYLPEPSTSAAAGAVGGGAGGGGAGEADPEEEALSKERRDEIHRALCEVRSEHRAALILRHMEGLSYREISEVLEVPEGTAKGWVSRGRAAMLVALADEQNRSSSSNSSSSSSSSSSSHPINNKREEAQKREEVQ